ncbi:MAG TPA: hypothetical protein DCL61_11990 [Cyanobacteria bacterium UBA12227]|nr:hypothetical protein [Cyanobacteria bacterium UBA12227]HAX84952.1 hypothetical protein [Cyanobacteria bacterium UBA11370]HBY77139.1 hypothetical protein [Cyanobacteria bacterium UBA11148]
MYKISQAIYQNGSLILSERLSPTLEGKRFKVIILDTDEIETRRERFFQLVEKHNFALPVNYRFNRDELYDR